MQQVTTFDIAIADGIVVDGKLQGISGKLRGQVLGMWNRLQQAWPEGSSAPDRQALPGYYASAYDRVSASVPVTSLRGMV